MEKVLVIFGGTRRYGNTEKLLNMFIDRIDRNKAEIDTVILKDLNISPCTSCYGCSKSGECIIEDDMKGLYDKIKKASTIILATPIYFGNVSALTKGMIDRCQSFWSAKYIANMRSHGAQKRGIFIATAGSEDPDSFKGTVYTVRLFFAACDASYSGDILIGNTDRIPVEDNKDVGSRVAELCRNIDISTQ